MTQPPRSASVALVVLLASLAAAAVAATHGGSTLQARLNAAVAGSGRSFELPPGDVLLGSQALTLQNAHGFTLTGSANGSTTTLWFSPGGGVVVANSSNCSVRRLTIAYGGPPGSSQTAAVAQFAVRRVLASANSCCPRVGDKGYDPCAANWPTPCCNATYELELHPYSLPIEGFNASVTKGFPGLRDCGKTRSQIFNNGTLADPPEGWLHTQCHASRPPLGFVPAGAIGPGGGKIFTVSKRFYPPFHSGNDHFDQDRLGTDIGKTHKRTPFDQANMRPINNASVGTRMVYYGREDLTYVVANSSQIITEDVTIHSATGFAIVELDGACGHTYRRVRLIRMQGKEDPLLIASNADAFHSNDCGRGPLIEDCELSNMMDDYMNIHSTLFSVVSVDAKSHALQLLMPRPRFFVGGRSNDGCGKQWSLSARDLYDGGSNPMQNLRRGDTLSCHHRDATLSPWANLTVDSVKPVEQPGASQLLPSAWILTITNEAHDDLEKAGPFKDVSCWIDHLSAKGAIVRGTHLHDGLPGAGIRWKSSDGRIENTVWERSRQTHIEIAPYSSIEGPLLIRNVHVGPGNVWDKQSSWWRVLTTEKWDPPCALAPVGLTAIDCHVDSHHGVRLVLPSSTGNDQRNFSAQPKHFCKGATQHVLFRGNASLAVCQAKCEASAECWCYDHSSDPPHRQHSCRVCTGRDAATEPSGAGYTAYACTDCKVPPPPSPPPPPLPSVSPDLIVVFGVSTRPATRACAGLLHTGPEYGQKLLAPLRMSSYRDGCFDEYSTLAAAGVTNIQCIVGDWFGGVSSKGPMGFHNFSGGHCYTSYPHNTSSCKPWPARDGNWSLFEGWVEHLMTHKPGPLLWYDIWNEPDWHYWPGCPHSCIESPHADFLELWRRTVLKIRSKDNVTKIVGPSTTRFTLSFLSAFVNFAVENSVMPDILNWHELTGGTTGAEIPQHHAEMRRWLQAHHPTFADIPIGHNENVPGTATLWAGATLGALAGAERAGAVMAVHSNWGESSIMHGSKFKQCGFDELMTCRDQPPIGNYSTRQPRAAYQVYATYGNTSGLMVDVDRHCGDADGFASYDANSTHESSSGGTASAWVVVGRYQHAPRSSPNRTVWLRLTSIPPALLSNSRGGGGGGGVVTRLALAKIPNRMEEAVPHPLPMGTAEHSVVCNASATAGNNGSAGGSDCSLDLKLVIGNHDVWTVRVTKP